MGNVSKDLGPVSAYALAVAHGFAGTEDEWAKLQAQSGVNARAAAENAAAAANSAAEAENYKSTARREAEDAQTSADSAAGSAEAAASSAMAAQESKDAAAESAAKAEAAAKEAKDVQATIPADYTTTYNRAINSAVAIPDESALAASHELHAQRDHPLNVAVHGYTYQEGEGDPSPDNVRPIHGLDTAQIRAGGKNLWSLGDMEIGAVGYCIFNSPLPAGQYTLSMVINTTDTDADTSLIVAKEEFGGRKYFYATRGSRYSATFMATNRVVGVDFYASNNYNPGLGDSATITQIQLELGSTATPYEPYLANVITPPLLPDGAPLMEGDTVKNDVLSGCDKCVTFDGSSDEVWESVLVESGGYVYYIETPESYDVGKVDVFKTNRMVVTGYTSSANIPDKHVGVFTRGDSYRFAIRDTGIPSVTDLRTTLAANPLTVYYRSTDYMPDKELRVCRVTRKQKQIENYAGETVPIGYVSSTGGLDMGAQVIYPLATPEVYMTNPLPLLPPAALESETVTVTGSGESSVEYAHDTKHFIIDFVTKALASQS